MIWTMVAVALVGIVLVAWWAETRENKRMREHDLEEAPKKVSSSTRVSPSKRAAPERIRQTSCPVAGCQIKRPHSHLADFLRRFGGK
jgi:hypothetical protein